MRFHFEAYSFAGVVPRVISSSARWLRPIGHRARSFAYAALLTGAFVSVLPMPVLAQQVATISGFLADSSGAGVPGASLALTNQDTAVVVITEKSDSTGNFSFQGVPAPGTYSISVQVSGFSRFEQRDIVVTQGERRSVGTLTSQRAYDKAEETYRHALVIRETLLGKDDADLIATVDGLAYAASARRNTSKRSPSTSG